MQGHHARGEIAANLCLARSGMHRLDILLLWGGATQTMVAEKIKPLTPAEREEALADIDC